MPARTLSEQEFNSIRDRVLSEAPAGMDEANFQRWIGPRFASAIAEAENSAPTPQGSALSRFASNAGEMLNPVAAVEGIGHAIAHPIDTAKTIVQGQVDQARQALASAKQGDLSSATGHGLAAVFPVIGPAAAAAGEQIAQGDIAGGLGKGFGLLLPSAAVPAARAAGSVARAVVPDSLRASIADSLASKAAALVTDVMAPKVGANKTRFGGMAEKVAPALASDSDMAAYSRQGLHAQVGAKLAAAEDALDAANDARLSARTFSTQPIIDALQAKRASLTAKAVEGSDVQRGGSLGADVIPAPNKARVAQIDQAISELKQLGPSARYDALRQIRAAYDGPAKTVYSPSMTADFLAKNGEALGAADVTGALRDQLAKFDPQTAQANAQYSLYKTANDVLDATTEIERSRPRVGRRIIGRLTGTILGEQAGGALGGVAGYAAGPLVDSVASSGWTTQLKTAQLLSKLATAIRSGSEGEVASLSTQLQVAMKRFGKQAAVIQGTTSPNGPQTSPAPAR